MSIARIPASLHRCICRFNPPDPRASPPLRPVNQQQPQNNQVQQQQPLRTASQPAFELERTTKEDGYYPWLGGQPDNPRGTDGRVT